MTLTDIIAKMTLFAKRAIVNDNSSNTTVSINQTGSGTGLSVKSVSGTSVLVENTNPVAGKGGKLEIFHPTNGDFVFDGGTDNKFAFVNSSGGTTSFNGGKFGFNVTDPTHPLETLGIFKVGRQDALQEGGQISFARANDNSDAWGVDVFGSGNNTTFRVTELTAGLTVLFIRQNGVVNITSLPIYADDAAAVTGGLFPGDIYKTATGELRIVV